jgi:hypothetical protein
VIAPGAPAMHDRGPCALRSPFSPPSRWRLSRLAAPRRVMLRAGPTDAHEAS